ncbi:hypothetical protein EDC01DRAFT_721319 [Geopyxis carbonaria]|nr:hypothetical protein EDC01DRAFT_721319 [Geopyxis carbonaria]
MPPRLFAPSSLLRPRFSPHRTLITCTRPRPAMPHNTHSPHSHPPPALALPTARHYSGASVRIVDVSARDGLQNEPTPVSLATKLELVRRLARCGLSHIEAGSFVSPYWVPAMATSKGVLEALVASDSTTSPTASSTAAATHTAAAAQTDAGTAKPIYSWLIPNLKGLAAFETVAPPPARHELAVFASASEGFSHKNTNCDIATSLSRLRAVVSAATARGYRVRGYVSMVIACPYSGPTPPSAVAAVTRALLEMGCYEVSLGDTNGVGTPRSVTALLRHLTQEAGVPVERLAAHWHDTYGMAIVNAAAALEMGVRVFDASVGGLGGCPYAKGATGNVAAEDLVWFLHGVGCDSGLSLEELARTGEWICGVLGRESGSRVGRALRGKRPVEFSFGLFTEYMSFVF